MVGIFTNIYKDKDLAITKEVIKLLKAYSKSFKLHKQLEGYINCEEYFDENTTQQFEFLISIGGDGTILRLAPFCAKNNIPVIGINMGNLGFLAEVEAKELENAAKLLSEGRFILQKRTMIEAKIGKAIFKGLNEVVLTRENACKMLKIRLNVNERFVDEFNCDGFIVSTSTGSTAYSLSAGGPILSPQTQAFALTPINTHSLYSRPLVISNKESVDLELVRKNDTNDSAAVFVDGVKVADLSQSEKISVSRCIDSISFIKLEGSDFYSRLFSKLNRPAAFNGEN